MNILLWVLQVALAALFLSAGIPKLMGGAQMVTMFAQIGLGRWFLYFTGSVEILSAILLLIPRRAGWGAALLIPTMIGATIACIAVLHMNPALPLGLLAIACFILWKRGL